MRRLVAPWRRWQALTARTAHGFPPSARSVRELASPSDEGLPRVSALRRKMAAYSSQRQLRLGWLLLPGERAVEILAASGDPQRQEQATASRSRA